MLSIHGQKSRTFSFLRFHVTTSIHVTMAAQCPMFIIRRAEYFQYSMLYMTLGIFVEIGSRSSGSIVTHYHSRSAFYNWILEHFTSLYMGIYKGFSLKRLYLVIYSVIEICWNHFILTNSIALPSAVYYFVTPDKSSAFLFWNSQAVR